MIVGLRHFLLAGLERHVRHALERHRRPAVGVAAAVRRLLADQMRLIARRLIVDEQSVLHQMPARRLDAVVVIAARGHGALLGLVGDDVHHLRAELELAQLVGGQEAGAGEVRFVAERAIELGRMADRFVNRQPQIARVQDQRLEAGRRRLGLVHRHRFFRGDLRFLQQRIAVDVFVAHAHRRGERGARIELAGRLVHGRHARRSGYERISDCSMCEPSLDAKYLCSLTNCMNADTKLAPGHLQRLLVNLQQQIELRLKRHVERVLHHRRVPGRAIRLDRRQRDRLGVDRAGWRGQSPRPARRRARSRPS